jgi:hypothetical protein
MQAAHFIIKKSDKKIKQPFHAVLIGNNGKVLHTVENMTRKHSIYKNIVSQMKAFNSAKPMLVKDETNGMEYTLTYRGKEIIKKIMF